MIAQTLIGTWTGDFWEHAAVVRELASNPFSPKHPQLITDVPHAYFSPYSLGVAFIARVMNLHPVHALSLTGIMNFVLIIICLRWFIMIFFEKQGEAISFYSLLFILVLWGKDPWIFSAFVHIYALGFVLPYPSTIAMALTFLSFSIYALYLKSSRLIYFLLLPPLMTTVLLTHPPTALFMYLFLFSLSLGYLKKFSYRNFLLLTCALLLSFLGAKGWPYYNFINLISEQSPDFHYSSTILYDRLLVRTFPLLLGVPIVVLRLRRNILDPLALTFTGLIVVYLYGYMSNNWGYGRHISHIAIILQITLATSFVTIDSRLSTTLTCPIL
jgi:alpha-1,6-mannosyltransferase